jgi:peptidoglycan/xylan/chitin deacetylase (PgdA/CDA1 family)
MSGFKLSLTFLFLSVLLFAPTGALAAHYGSSVLLPTSPWYFLQRTRESIELLFTFSAAARRTAILSHAHTRLLEAEALAQENPKLAGTAVAEYTLLVKQAVTAAHKEPDMAGGALAVDSSLQANAEILKRVGPKIDSAIRTPAETTAVWAKSELNPNISEPPPPTAAPTPLPSPSTTPAGSPLPLTTASPVPLPLITPEPVNNWEFVSETIPDRSQFAAGSHFKKTWTIRNAGTTVWKNYALRAASTANLAEGSQAVFPMDTANPGSSLSISIPMTAPTTPGTYLSSWQVATGQNGQAFGKLLTALVAVSDPNAPPVTSAPRLSAGSTNIPIVMFHYIRSVDGGKDPLGFALSVTPENFEGELRYLQDHNYHTVSLDDAHAAITKGASLPPKPVILTFDDGYIDFYTTAYPLLKKYHFIGVTYAVPGFCGNSRYMSWEQLKEVSDGGMEIAAHTVHHIDLTAVSADVARQEIAGSRQQLEQRLGITVRHFAYPYGKLNEGVVQSIREAGFLTATTTYPGRTHTSDNLLTLRRVRASGGESLATFISKVQW